MRDINRLKVSFCVARASKKNDLYIILLQSIKQFLDASASKILENGLLERYKKNPQNSKVVLFTEKTELKF